MMAGMYIAALLTTLLCGLAFYATSDDDGDE